MLASQDEMLSDKIIPQVSNLQLDFQYLVALNLLDEGIAKWGIKGGEQNTATWNLEDKEVSSNCPPPKKAFFFQNYCKCC